MTGKDKIMLSQKELQKVHVIQRVADQEITQVEAAGALALSDRQVRRLLSKFRAEGSAGMAHRSRGRESSRKISRKVREEAIAFYREKLAGFGPKLAAEKLAEFLGMRVSDETLRKWLLASGDWKRARKSRVHRERRERKAQFGEMVQFDGSHHDWFEGRGPRCVLMGYIDDATSRVHARFYEYEGVVA